MNVLSVERYFETQNPAQYVKARQARSKALWWNIKMTDISEWKKKRIEQMWRKGWSIGAICDKVNVTQHTVYQYVGRIPIIGGKERKDRKKMPKDYLPPALLKRYELEKISLEEK